MTMKEMTAPSRPHMQRHREIQVERLRDKLEELAIRVAADWAAQRSLDDTIARMRVVLDDLEIVRAG